MFSPETALDQLASTHSGNGIGRLHAMVGAKDFVTDIEGRNVQFGFKSCRKANKCRLTLTRDDLYTIEFFKFNRRTFDCPCVETVKGLNFTQLTEIFENFTGLFLTI